MNKTKIEWTNYTWNPIKGICPVGCWYCYARRIYQRFGWKKDIWLGQMPNFEFRKREDLYLPINPKHIGIDIPKRIFVCSTIEIFHPKVLRKWRDWIFDEIKNHPEYIFQILTKLPQNIDRPMPDNVWLGVTVTDGKQLNVERNWQLEFPNYPINGIKFMSIEPLLADIKNFTFEFYPVDWVIVGRLTQCGHKYDPKREWIERIVDHVKGQKVPIFLKDNLRSIWGADLIQEMPK